MGKGRQRFRKTSVFGSIEGDLELALWLHLKELYCDNSKTSIQENPLKGGNPNVIVNAAIQQAHTTEICFAWIDEDLNINEETRSILAKCWNLKESNFHKMLQDPISTLQYSLNSTNRNPILIVSQPICADGFLLKLLDKKIPHEIFDHQIRVKQIQNTKSSFKAIAGTEIKNQFKYIQENLTKGYLEKKRSEILELDLLLQMVSGICNK